MVTMSSLPARPAAASRYWVEVRKSPSAAMVRPTTSLPPSGKSWEEELVRINTVDDDVNMGVCSKVRAMTAATTLPSVSSASHHQRRSRRA